MNCRKLKGGRDGTVFHVCNRGVLKKPIFLDDFDFHICEQILGESAEKYEVPLFAYCLMPNHWHLLVEAPTGEMLVKMLQRFSSVHARTIRRKQENQGTGAVYQSRFRAHAVQKNEAFLKVRNYIEQNPVKAGLCAKPEDWAWGSANKKQKKIGLAEPKLWLPKTQGGETEESWHHQIEAALFSQKPLGDLNWRRMFLASSTPQPALEQLAA